MSKKNSSNININNVKGNVVVSNNQSGGITANGHNIIPPSAKRKPFYNNVILWVGLIGSILTILAYFGLQPKSKENKNLGLPAISRKLNTTSIPHPVKSVTLFDTIKPKKHHLRKKIMENKGEKDTNKKPIYVDNVKGDVVISQNQSGGITAHTVNINEEKVFNQADRINLLNFIETVKKKYNFNPTCFTISMVNNSNGNKIASQIETVLKEQGYTMKGDYGYMMRYPPVRGIIIDKDPTGDCLQILVGQL
ncbi:MAG TPA: hypothetical protein VFE53_08795 [Mucilaginibacter sp.]|jgi:hypothetical protein|nr:hypothetical protein [Mucilaginibacter sp.]